MGRGLPPRRHPRRPHGSSGCSGLHAGRSGKGNRLVETLSAQRVVLNLKDWEGDVAALRRQFDQWPIGGLKELAVVTRDGTIRQIVRETERAS